MCSFIHGLSYGRSRYSRMPSRILPWSVMPSSPAAAMVASTSYPQREVYSASLWRKVFSLVASVSAGATKGVSLSSSSKVSIDAMRSYRASRRSARTWLTSSRRAGLAEKRKLSGGMLYRREISTILLAAERRAVSSDDTANLSARRRSRMESFALAISCSVGITAGC